LTRKGQALKTYQQKTKQRTKNKTKQKQKGLLTLTPGKPVNLK
jgi:hypothetical protein